MSGQDTFSEREREREREIGLFRSYRKPSEAGTGPGQEEDRRLAQVGEVVQLKRKKNERGSKVVRRRAPSGSNSTLL